MVVPEHRNGPVAPLLVKKLNEAVDIGLTLHVEEAALRVFKGVGWRHLGVLPQYVRVLNARAFVRTFAQRGGQFLTGRRGAAVGGAARACRGRWPRWSALAFARACRRRARCAGAACAGATVAEEHAFDASYTELAERVKGKLGVWVFRDERYLAARYGRRMGAYRLLACRARGPAARLRAS